MKALSIVLGLSALLSAQVFAAPATNLDQLLIKVKEDRIAQKKELKEREAKFLSNKNKQASLLSKAKAELAKLEAESKRLQKSFQKNEKRLAVLEQELTIASGNLGEMFGVVKQVAGDLRGQLQNSNISAQYQGRDKSIADLAESKKLPNIKAIEGLWYALQFEMTESGKILTFNGTVVLPNGSKKEQEILRVGSFNLVSDSKYLSYQAATNQITEIPRQPEGKYVGMIDDSVEAKKGEIIPFGLDPSRGAILSMLVQAPSFMERIQQGGLVGYVILTLLFIGLILVVERFIYLNGEKKKIAAQLTATSANENNVLGQLMAVYDKFADQDLETLELKLDEAVLKSAPKLERGISTIKILFAVSPLLGLLGTVTGMIATFQSITLFGTGDPKLMAGGISSALMTTVLGLVCAIPMLLLHTVISGKSKEIIQILEEQSTGFLAQRAEKLQEGK